MITLEICIKHIIVYKEIQPISYANNEWSLYRDEARLSNAQSANLIAAADFTGQLYSFAISVSFGGFGSALENSSLSGSRNLLLGPLRNNFNRFLSKIPANSKSTVTVEILKDGNYAFSDSSAGKVPGSRALYQKFVDAAGNTMKYLKTTFGPDGKIIHVKPK